MALKANFSIRWAVGDLAQTFAAHSRPTASSCSCGTTAFTMPIRWASAAE